MKKYLMMGAAALLMGASFTSCSKDKDLYDPQANAMKFLQDYQAAFVQVFGDVNAYQSWGFSSANQARMTRAITPNYDFSAAIPQKPTTDQMAAENFKENVDGIEAYTSINNGNGFATGTAYVSGSTNINIWSNNPDGALYFTGTCDLTNNSVYIGGYTTIYLVKNAQVTLNNGFQGGCKVYIAEGAKLTINNDISTGNVSYYIKGGSFEAKNDLVVNGGHEFFAENATVKVGDEFQVDRATYYANNTSLEIGGFQNLIGGALFYNEGGVITCTGKQLNNSSKFYTDANSSFSEISENGISVTYNGPQATMTTGVIKVNNGNATGTDGSVLINDGTLNGTYLGTEGGAFFENGGTANISGETRVDSNGNTWVNDGTYNTEYFLYTAGSTQVINNCRLNVEEDFFMNLGSTDRNAFRMDAGSGFVTKNLYLGGGYGTYTGGPFYITMGSGSVIEVTNTAIINASVANYGIYGPSTGEYAVLHANEIKCMPGQENQGFKVTYGGSKLAVVSETTHFPQGHDGNPSHPYIDFKEGCTIENIYAEGFNTNAPAINIPESTCNPGFRRGGGEQPETKQIRVMAEDVAATAGSDIDFNDVVFDVKATFPVGATSVDEVTITVHAAGGTIPLYIGTPSTPKINEVHAKLGVTDTRTMINTNAQPYADNVNWFAVDGKAPQTFTLATTVRKDYFLEDVRDYVVVTVTNEGSDITVTATQGQAAGKIAVPVGTPWAKEKVNMADVFGQFKTWVNTAAPANWYESYDPDKVAK